MSQSTQDLSFDVLSLLSKARAIYGLRNGDHERYRKHCVNKMHRLRLSTGLASSSGKGKVYKKPAAITEATAKNVKHLQLLLFSAERALAHSHELKALLTRPNPPPGTKKEQISWLRRAVKFSSSLHAIAKSLAAAGQVNQQTLAGITVYHLSVTSELSFEKYQWAETITSLAVRRRLLSTFADAARDSYAQALSLEFMDAYDPLIRFAAYKLGRSESHDIAGVVADIDAEMQEEASPGIEALVEALRAELGSQEMEEGRRKLEDVKFAGEPIEMRSAEMVGVMTKVQAAMAAMQGKGKGMRGWDRVLGVLGEAEAVARRLVDDHEASGTSNPLRSAETATALSRAHHYTIYLLLSHRIRRDLLLSDTLLSTSKVLPEDITQFKIPGGKVKLEDAVKTLAGLIKLYDQILQSLGQAAGLGLVQERDEVRVGVEGLESFYHATRNLVLARLHCIHPTPSYSSAVRLLSRSSVLARQARTSLVESGLEIAEPIVPVSATDISDLEARISALEFASKRALFSERVDKPVFFDTAFNYIDLPMDELLYRAGKGPKPDSEAKAAEQVAPIVQAASATAQQAVKAVEAVPERVKGLVRSTREATPGLITKDGRMEVDEGDIGDDDEEEEEDDSKPAQQQQQGKKGWLGGWFGRG